MTRIKLRYKEWDFEAETDFPSFRIRFPKFHFAKARKFFAKVKRFIIYPKTYRGLVRYGQSRFISDYGFDNGFKKLVCKGIRKKQYPVRQRKTLLGWVSRLSVTNCYEEPKMVDLCGLFIDMVQ